MLIFLKYLSLYLCSLYATDKICHIKSDFKIILLQSASLSLLVWLIAVIFPNQFAFLPFILYLGYIYMMVKNIRLSIVSGFISYGISLALMTLIGFIISSIFSLFRASYTHSPFTLITIIICLLTPPIQELSGSITGDFCSDHMMINAVLSYLQKKASAQQATLTFTMDTDFFNHITAHLDDEQIAHLLADLGQNALIATLPCESRCIHIALSMTKSIPSICISDSGTPFPTVVLEHLGLEKCSQHLDEGGSGIGLMDLWKLKSSSKATLLIKEDSSPDTLYTKYIYLIFNTQGRYIIESDRITELHKHLSRTDVTLINE